ncbi:MAG: fructose-bisphosphate aldolase class I [Alphaproteobacteria bacterium]|nr:fructose-bisphosphate aldolase class I [Alphaproteobacteria bacterium]
MAAADLEAIARKMVEGGRGILAADESNSTANKRLASVKVDGTVENRQAYREMLFSTPRLGEYISGAILYDETIRQGTKAGVPFVKVLNDQNILPGIKVDAGTKKLSGSPNETITEGLDGLGERLTEYAKLGAKFTKWRAVITPDEKNKTPTDYGIHVNAHALARYAKLAQDAGLVPIVEPEVLMDGTHTIETAREITERTLHCVFNELYAQKVMLEGIVLKPNMVIAAQDCPKQASREQVAEWTVKTLKRFVPGAVPGIAFLSGGQDEAEATEHLNLMNKMGPLPWKIGFSYGRALQHSSLTTWAGKSANIAVAQRVLAHRSKMNWAASTGKYTAEMEKAA